MFFGSKFAYINKDDDALEEIADDDFDEGIKASALKQEAQLFSDAPVSSLGPAPPKTSVAGRGAFPTVPASSAAKPVPPKPSLFSSSVSKASSSSSSSTSTARSSTLPTPIASSKVSVPQKQPVLSAMQDAMKNQSQQQQQQQQQMQSPFFSNSTTTATSTPMDYVATSPPPLPPLFGATAAPPPPLATFGFPPPPPITTATATAAPPLPMPMPPVQYHKAPKRIQKADTNVVSIRLGTLAENAHLMTGDPVACSKCASYLSAVSKLEKGEQDNVYTWNCEFCDNINKVQLEKEEVPIAETLDYILEPAPIVASSEDEGSVIFCIDISGSMCVTTEVQGKLKLRGDDKRNAALAALNTERASQHMPGQRQNVSYISRLQCVQAAVGSQLDDLEKHFPKSPVGIVTFNNEVTIVGDGVQEQVVITGDKLNNFDQLVQVGQAFNMEKCIKESKQLLEGKLFDLEERGQTALGPAVVIAVAMAARRKGSKVILCTDGLSNIGVGSLANLNQNNEQIIESFYNKIGTYAKENGVTISVISIEGTDCNIENLGVLTDLTTGKVDIVNPLKLTTNFSSILANPIIATNVEVSFLLHHGLGFKNEESVFDPENTFKAVRNTGNVTADTEISFEYGIRTSANNLGLNELPFQVQIRFSRINGMKCVRVITRKQAVTQKREEAEKEADIDVLALGAMQHAAKIAQQGNYSKAREKVYANQRLMNRANVINNYNNNEQYSAYSDYVSEAAELDTAIQQQQVQEKSEGIDFDSTETTNVDDSIANERYRARKNARSDEVSKVIWQHKNKPMKKK